MSSQFSSTEQENVSSIFLFVCESTPISRVCIVSICLECDRYYESRVDKVVDQISTILYEFDLCMTLIGSLGFGLMLDINVAAPEIVLVPRAKIVVTDKTKICLFKMPINQIL